MFLTNTNAIVMSVIRMIKLFGWESRIYNQIDEKREEELALVWKRKLLGVGNAAVKYVQCVSHFICSDKYRSRIVPLIHMLVTYWLFVCASSCL